MLPVLEPLLIPKDNGIKRNDHILAAGAALRAAPVANSRLPVYVSYEEHVIGRILTRLTERDDREASRGHEGT